MNSVLKGAGYVLVHAPDMVIHNGTTQTTERAANPDSEYLQALPHALRDYASAVGYYPNQVYIGNRMPQALADLGDDRAALHDPDATRSGRFGEIMPQEEFYLLLQMCDVFGVCRLEQAFVAAHRAAVAAHPLYDDELKARLADGVPEQEIARLVAEEHAEGLYHGGALIGCVRRAHDFDPNLSAHVMLENLVAKASCVLSMLHTLHTAGVPRGSIDYVIDCCEEACGDMNQRGGGNFAKAAAEIAGLENATGSDLRAFCAAPAHAIINAAALVASGAYETVMVAAGGCTAKLGMNAKDHVKKGLPVLEDMLAGFAVIIARDNGVDPIIDLSMLGRHTVGTGSAPQAVISALVSAPLAKQGLGILDVDKYSVEMQNPDITKPAGAGNVPESNYKMIGALAARNGEMTPKDLPDFIKTHGMPGWAPTQGHIPSGVPYLGFARDAMLGGTLGTAMILGKGSLFLGRMTNLFDGVSFLLRRNGAAQTAQAASAHAAAPAPAAATGRARIALTAPGSELAQEELLAGAVAAARAGVEVIFLGTLTHPELTCLPAASEDEARARMEQLLASGEADGAVTMHHPFPIGVATVGRARTAGGALYLAATTGTSSTDRVEGMVRNAVYGIAAAKACGVESPTVGILNLDGARAAETALKRLARNGYPIAFARSKRADGGCIMRGNDVLSGACDVLVTDSLTGNVLSKMLSAAGTGGLVEDTGDGYGPAVGAGYDKLVLIISRASGAKVVDGALRYAAELARGQLHTVAARELAAAADAGLDRVLTVHQTGTQEETVEIPPAEVVTQEIAGIEILELDHAARVLWKAGIYAATGMGCTGPVILVSEENADRARALLQEAGHLA